MSKEVTTRAKKKKTTKAKKASSGVRRLRAKPAASPGNAYMAAFEHLAEKGDVIVDWKINRTLEEAKRLSVNSEFQMILSEIRDRYRISPRRQDKLINIGVVLDKYTAHLSAQKSKNLEQELSDLADKFHLNWFDEGDDYGLIVGALCYGLTPENLTTHWDQLKYSMSKTRTPGARIFLDYQDNVKEKLISMIVISYLFLQLRKAGVPISLPEPIRQVIEEALKTLGRAGETPERASEYIKKFNDTHFDPRVFINIELDTTLEDIKRTWPQVEMRKVELLLPPAKESLRPRGRVWRNYERDIFVWRKVKKHGVTYEQAYDAWLSEHPDDQVVELTAVIKSVSTIKFVPDDSE